MTAHETGGCAPPVVSASAAEAVRARPAIDGDGWVAMTGLAEHRMDRLQAQIWNAAVTAAERVLATAPAGPEALDASRWRALIGSGRVRCLGSAGLHTERDPYGNEWNGYAHIGVELWTKHPAGSEPDAIRLLTKYADIAIEAAPGKDEAP